MIAKQCPRNELAAVDKIMNACTRESLAESALYSYPRGGQEVTGPSIRLAEAMAQHWGNMQFGIRELSAENGVSTVEAFAWDMETNTRQVKVFQVAHQRYTRSKGLTKLTDPRDIYELVANQGARRLRACILGVIPGDVTEAAVKQCEVTQANSVEVTPDAIKKMVEVFGRYGVTTEMIEKRIGRRLDAINAPVMLSLRKVHQSIKDGMGKPGDFFDIGDVEQVEGPKVSDLSSAVQAKKPMQTADTEKESAEPGQPEQPANAPTFASVAAKITAAKTAEELQAIGNGALPAFLLLEGNEKFTDELNALYRGQMDTFINAQS